MAYREVAVTEVHEVLRQWIAGAGTRTAGRFAGVDRKTARRYIEAAVALGVHRDGSTAQLTDELIGAVIGAVRPGAEPSWGRSREVCREHEALIRGMVKDGLTLTRAHELLARRVGGALPYRTLVRYVREELGVPGRKRTTVRVADCAPGAEVQVDFGLMGLIDDKATGKRRKVHALIFTAVRSRHCFVHLAFSQGVDDVIEGFDAAWSFFGGVFRVVVIDNLKAVVIKADALSPQLNASFLEYAQSRDFAIDTARVRSPDDKPRVESSVRYVRERFFKGESWTGLAQLRACAATWCRDVAGARVHGTTRQRPLEAFEREEAACLRPPPGEPFDIPQWSSAKVGRDQHFVAGKALYSVPTHLVGQQLRVRQDRAVVKAFLKGKLVKVHPRAQPGERRTDPADYPEGVADVALRRTGSLVERAARHGDVIGRYAEALIDSPLPWTRMRHVHRLPGLVRRYGAGPVSDACSKALACEVIDATRIERMLQLALESSPPPPSAPAKAPRSTGNVIHLRFARRADEFAITHPSPPNGGPHAQGRDPS